MEDLRWRARILESAAEGVFGVDAGGRITFANRAAAERLGYAPEELVGRHAHALLHRARSDGIHHSEEECPIHEALRARRVVRVGAEEGDVFWTRTGEPFPAMYSISPIRERGRVAGAAVVYRDVTHRLRRQDEREIHRREAAQSEKLAAMGTLVSGVSHEIRTPLTILLNHAFLARRKLEARAAASPEARAISEALDPHLREIDRAVERMNALVGELRRFSRLDGMEVAPLPLEGVVAEAARIFQLAYRSSVGVELDLHETPPVLVDRHKVQQLVLNLLENAADATIDHGGVVRVLTRAEPGDGRARLVVQDEGPGIPEEVRARMYEPLYTTKEHGTGLGLAVVKRIVDEHGASIECSTSPGGGSAFVVSFPLAADG